MGGILKYIFFVKYQYFSVLYLFWFKKNNPKIDIGTIIWLIWREMAKKEG